MTRPGRFRSGMPRPGGPATERLRATLMTGLGVASLVYTALGLGAAGGQLERLHVFGTVLYALCAALPPLAGLLALRGHRHTAVPLALTAVYCLLVLLAIVLWLPLMTAPQIPQPAPWPYSILTIPAAAAGLLWSPPAAWCYLGILSVATGLLRHATAPVLGWIVAVQDAVFAFTFAAVFLALIQGALAGGRELDRSAAVARAATAREARLSSEHRQRIRLDALVHDHVLAVLLAAGRGDPAVQDQVPASARTALELLHDSPAGPGDPVPAREAAARIRDAVPAGFEWHARVPEHLFLPPEAAAALVEATTEAVRNSCRHAGDAARRVHVRGRSGEAAWLRVRIEDEGTGFEPAAVPSERLGLRVSVLERMSALPGGSASVRSAPGRGTVVDVCWQAP